ncbi:MAG TPA: S9 family peptidase [Marinilabiliales bacterium]|nr:MAG: prolyl endopeptidase [Bacteroidetes bacterium GWA2_40_14]OFX57219.1 MAG: prolyl endopeptidase [Bacteroidetes bacterium GWC2_40_13]OFX72321.1 MAG: prolyl endopeptidase [Bacteroidetes bacterium GWD2_40_43]OFX90431.1 MAG: prolyl endopeptidase [Bacteroidetes bacterium GWE2_40_63]OFY17323.1 MAG: prolyl endopeptidase [Bacteroidetes bacterium GWF2_40_13]OFZ27332.1 MAG: prolyl endopeptidase [Bacteroidetes bacterium RIFOXYC2_FULL_40_12]HAN00894.1 S9 family peptidase [Marinilabiliales bacterium
MNKCVIVVLLFVGLASCQPKEEKLNYPMTRKVDTVDHYFGTAVADPYRWLEDDNSDSTKAWVVAQNAVTNAYLAKIPYRTQINSRLTKLWDYPKISAPFHEGGRYFVFKNNGLQNQSVAYLLDSIGGNESVILDPNTFSDDGTVSLTAFSPSDDGKLLGYGISKGGSDWNEFFVKNIETGELLPDHIEWVKFSGIQWLKDGFFYSRFPAPKEDDILKGVNENSKIYYHKIGTTQTDDQLVYEDTEHPNWGFGAWVTDDQKLLVIAVTESTSGNAFYVKDIEKGGNVIKIVESFDNDFQVIDHQNGKLLVMTNYQAPKYKVIAIDLTDYAREKWVDFIPEKEGVLTGVSIIGGKMIATYLKDAHSHVEVNDLAGKYLYDLELPVLGSVSGFNGERDDKITFFTITSFTTPATVYKYDIENNKSGLYQTSAVDFDPEAYETKQVFFTSNDGTKVPMFIVHKKGLKLDGKNPVLLYGYGGFNVSLTPSFNVGRLIWLEQGGVYAMANLRGGGEYGEDWHKAGTLMQKQNVFDDCIAAAEYLISEKYTSKGKIALLGGSNGGLLVGAVANQRPELFGAALPAVGVMDMLRYHKFTIGRYWATDYGTSEDSEEMFKYLYAYSPVHTIKENVEYPAVLVTTADHDDRVVPAHSFKYIATLQEKYKGTNPVIIRIESKAGHGAGKPTAKIIEEYSDMYAFMFKNLGVDPVYKE